jgi:hypothetical protein
MLPPAFMARVPRPARTPARPSGPRRRVRGTSHSQPLRRPGTPSRPARPCPGDATSPRQTTESSPDRSARRPPRIGEYRVELVDGQARPARRARSCRRDAANRSTNPVDELIGRGRCETQKLSSPRRATPASRDSPCGTGRCRVSAARAAAISPPITNGASAYRPPTRPPSALTGQASQSQTAPHTALLRRLNQATAESPVLGWEPWQPLV